MQLETGKLLPLKEAVSPINSSIYDRNVMYELSLFKNKVHTLSFDISFLVSYMFCTRSNKSFTYARCDK